jgi:hypothetical protein
MPNGNFRILFASLESTTWIEYTAIHNQLYWISLTVDDDFSLFAKPLPFWVVVAAVAVAATDVVIAVVVEGSLTTLSDSIAVHFTISIEPKI